MMKKLLSVLLIAAVLCGSLCLFASAVDQAEAEKFAEDFTLAVADYEAKVAARVEKLSDNGKRMLNYEITEKTKAAKQTWLDEQSKFPTDYDALLAAYKKYHSVRLITTQGALTIKVPNKVWKMLGESTFGKTLNYMWSWVLRYLLFGWAFLPY